MTAKALLIDPYARTITETTWRGEDVTEAADVLGVEWIETLAFDERHLLLFDEEGLLKNQTRRGDELVAQAYFVVMVAGELVMLAGPALLIGGATTGRPADCSVNDAQLRARVSFVKNTIAAWRLAQELLVPIMVDDTTEGRNELAAKLRMRQVRIRELIVHDTP